MMKKYRVNVIIPTYKPDEKFHKLMRMLMKQEYEIERILIMNTEESLFQSRGYEKIPNVEIRHLNKQEFDHGGTRDRAASLMNGDLLLFMTQDAVPADEYLVGQLVTAFADEQVMAAYARQLPEKDCKIIEKYTRSFNYPSISSVKSKEDLPVLGIKTFFCSNACAMYRKSEYDRLGGFEKRTIFGEDMILAAKIVQNGGSVAYVAEAKAVHSHNLGNIEQLRRNFDLAVAQADHPEIFKAVKSESEGLQLVKKTAAYLLKIKKPWLIISLVIKSGFKFIGYRLGKMYKKLPRRLIIKLTMNKAYWK